MSSKQRRLANKARKKASRDRREALRRKPHRYNEVTCSPGLVEDVLNELAIPYRHVDGDVVFRFPNSLPTQTANEVMEKIINRLGEGSEATA